MNRIKWRTRFSTVNSEQCFFFFFLFYLLLLHYWGFIILIFSSIFLCLYFSRVAMHDSVQINPDLSYSGGLVQLLNFSLLQLFSNCTSERTGECCFCVRVHVRVWDIVYYLYLLICLSETVSLVNRILSNFMTGCLSCFQQDIRRWDTVVAKGLIWTATMF